MVRHHGVLHEIGADIDDAAKALRPHARQRRLRGVERGAHAFELAGYGLPAQRIGVRTGIAVEAEGGQRVVHHGANGHAKVRARLLKHGLHGLRITHIRLHGQRLAGMLRRQRAGRLQAMQTVDEHARALRQKGLRNGAAQTARAARHQYGLRRQRRAGCARNCVHDGVSLQEKSFKC